MAEVNVVQGDGERVRRGGVSEWPVVKRGMLSEAADSLFRLGGNTYMDGIVMYNRTIWGLLW